MRFRLLVLMITTAPLAACGTAHDALYGPGKMSPISYPAALTPSKQQALPISAVAREPLPQPASANSLWRTGAREFLGDQRASRVGDILTITLTASLFGNTDALNALRAKKTGSGGASTALANALYYNTFTFVAKPPGATSDRDNNIAIWGAQNGAAMRADLTLAMGKLSSMLAADLQTNAADRAAGTASTLSGLPVQVVSTDGDGETVRLKGGNLEFAEKSMVAP